MAFTEFYMTSGGSQLNSGSTSGNGSVYTSASGNWVQATRVFTPTDGQTTSSLVSVGDDASVYLNAATVGVYIGRVSAVGAGVNGTITIDATANYGSAPANSTGGITVKVGGAWLGPNGATAFPFGLAGTIGALKNAAGDQVRVNAKNDQTYTMTAALAFTTLGKAVMQGYTGSVGDLGKAIFTSNITTAANFTVASGNPTFVDLIFASTGASNANDTFQSTQATDLSFLRCVFHGARRCGFLQISTAGNAYLYECEAYDCNKSNTATIGAFDNANTVTGIMFCYNCYSHDNTGSNAHGFVTGDHGSMILVNCISESNGGSGALWSNTGGGGFGAAAINCNFYNNTGDGVKLAQTIGTWSVLMNNNFLLNAKGVNNTTASSGGILYNNGRGAGTQANTGADVLQSIVNTSTDITYASNVTPWNAPTTGDFTTLKTSTAFSAGRGVFVETDGTNTGTLSYPDIGASQALATRGGALPLAGTGGLAS